MSSLEHSLRRKALK